HLPHAVAGDLQHERQHAAAGLDLQHRLAGDAVVVDVLGDAAHAVAAHLRLAAVGVEHAHAGVAALGPADEDEPAGADAEVPVADRAAQRGGILRQRLAKAVDVDVVVAAALHFHEAHVHHSHSIVAGGLLLISYTTRFTPDTRLMIRVEIFASNSYGKCDQ